MNYKEIDMVQKAAFFISIWYAPWFFKCDLTVKAPVNDLQAFQQVYCICYSYLTSRNIILQQSMQRHTWYLTEQLILLSLADDDVKENEKTEIMMRLIEHEKHQVLNPGKPQLPVISKETKISDLVGPESNILLSVAGVSQSEVESG